MWRTASAGWPLRSPVSIPAVSIRLAFGGPVEGFGSYADALAAAPAEPLPEQPRGSDMLYSSGTTGRPKGIKAPLPDRQVDEPGDPYVQLFVPYFGFSADSVYLSQAPPAPRTAGRNPPQHEIHRAQHAGARRGRQHPGVVGR